MNIGIEIEFTGVSRKEVAIGLAEKWLTDYEVVEYEWNGEKRIKYQVTDCMNQVWNLVLDKSIHPVACNSVAPLDYAEYMCELVSPILEYEELSCLKTALSVIRRLGGFTNESCGVHIHVDYPNDVSIVRDWFSRFFEIQKQLPDLFGIPENRLQGYCKLYPDVFVTYFNKAVFTDLHDFLSFFYERLGEGMSWLHPKNAARYYMLNMDSLTKQSTIEFRFFNGSLGIQTIEYYIDWVKIFISEGEVN